MKKSLLAVTIALAFSAHAQVAFAQAAISTGGAGGAGGTAAGGTAAGGAATNSNTLTTTGGSGGGGGQGGTGGLGGTGGTAAGGAATATGVQTGAITGTGNSQAAEVTVNYITPVSPGGLKGLAAGVDPETGHFVNDNNVRYSGTQKIKNTPDASIGGPASGPCNGFSGGIGVSVPGFAVGANTSTVDPGCTARETARIAAMLGRMDIANAVLENTSVVQEALKAKAARQAAEQAPPPVARLDAPVQAAPAPVQSVPAPVQSTPNREIEAARLSEQQRLAVEALKRKATMDKVYDTLTFTDAVTQGNEKTPQQAMAEEATRIQAARAKRQDEHLKLQRRLVALKSEPPEEFQNTLAPVVPNVRLALAVPKAAPVAAPVAAAAPTPAAPSVAAKVLAGGIAGGPSVECCDGKGRSAGADERTAAHARPRASREIAAQCRAPREQCERPVDGQGSGPDRGTRDRSLGAGRVSTGAVAPRARFSCAPGKRATAARFAARAPRRENGQAERFVWLYGCEASNRPGCAGRRRPQVDAGARCKAGWDATGREARCAGGETRGRCEKQSARAAGRRAEFRARGAQRSVTPQETSPGAWMAGQT